MNIHNIGNSIIGAGIIGTQIQSRVMRIEKSNMSYKDNHTLSNRLAWEWGCSY